MLKTIIISVGILLICFVFLAIQVIFSKKKKFPDIHVSQNKAMRERGIHCVQTQDWEERHRQGLYGNGATLPNRDGNEDGNANSPFNDETTDNNITNK